ncbi:MAG TPA: hypothetical protein VFE98_06050 [Candidatus Bathyarchaeia archaeon]|nr:hypothetical protein [Candidatus Bathyarchaeia archaeon]
MSSLLIPNPKAKPRVPEHVKATVPPQAIPGTARKTDLQNWKKQQLWSERLSLSLVNSDLSARQSLGLRWIPLREAGYPAIANRCLTAILERRA